METTQITLSFEGSPTPEVIAAKLRFQAGLLEGMSGKKAASRKNTDVEPEENLDQGEQAEEIAEDEDFAPKKKPAKSKAAASFESEEEAAVEEPEEEEAPKAKKTKAPTYDDVSAACKAHAKEHSFEETKALLLKKFKTSSLTKLNAADYAKVIAAVKV